MKTMIQFFAATALLYATPVWASHEGHEHGQDQGKMHGQGHDHGSMAAPAEAVKSAAANDMVEIAVNGLVCDFCARALEKVFAKREEVAGIHVDLDNGKIHVAMKPGKTLDDATLTSMIKDSGYDVTGITRGH